MLPYIFPKGSALIGFYLFLCAIACQSQQGQPANSPDLSALKNNLETDESRAAYDSLHLQLTAHYTDLTTAARSSLRQALKKQAHWPFEFLCPASEPGTHILLKGRVTDENGAPIAGAEMHIFHTDSRGYYSPLDSVTGRMMENDPRLEGFLTTDANGGFEIHTVRPANYPRQYKGRTIPQHVHLVTTADGFQVSALQVVFKDDPVMDDYWVEWAKEAGFPIVTLVETPDGIIGEVDLKLKKE